MITWSLNAVIDSDEPKILTVKRYDKRTQSTRKCGIHI